MMKQLAITFSALIFFMHVQAQHYTPVDESSEIKFTIKNFGISTPGTFKGLKGSIAFSPDNLSAAFFNATIDAATINTGIDTRNNHLKKEEYFNVAKYPLINFVSTRLTANETEKNTYTLFGKLTIKGTTKEISFPFKAEQQGNGILFTGSFKINRRDFKVGGNSMVLGDNVEIFLKVFAKKL